MKITCFVDIGNTRIKYSVNDHVGEAESILQLSHVLLQLNVNEVIVACVAGKADQLKVFCDEQGIVFYRARVAADAIGLRLVYSDISKLGVDRWLAMVAAIGLFADQNLVVVDAGTALKIDAVTKASAHIGGSISPGIKMSFNALQQNTAQLPSVSAEFDGHLGTDTLGSMRYGVVMSAVALISKTVVDLPGEFKLVLTGGDAVLLAAHLNSPVEVIDNLVIGGLKRLHKNGYFTAKEST